MSGKPALRLHIRMLRLPLNPVTQTVASKIYQAPSQERARDHVFLLHMCSDFAYGVCQRLLKPRQRAYTLYSKHTRQWRSCPARINHFNDTRSVRFPLTVCHSVFCKLDEQFMESLWHLRWKCPRIYRAGLAVGSPFL